ncbi:hypothetical protein, partial [Leptobacterium sp. I13]|uniref:hypothetical protein n=1 Tax=Leptobacterium meishanense TaxID=3128904 RepID=UPI0030EE6F32
MKKFCPLVNSLLLWSIIGVSFAHAQSFNNKIPNPGFESGTLMYPFNRLPAASRGGLFVIDSLQVHSGRYAAKLTSAPDSDTFTSPWFGDVLTTLDPSKQYVSSIGAWVKGQAGTQVRTYIFYKEVPYSPLVPGAFQFKKFTLSGDWQWIEHSFTSPEGHNLQYASIRLDVITPGESVYWDDLSFKTEEVAPLLMPFTEGLDNDGRLEVVLGKEFSDGHALVQTSAGLQTKTLPWKGSVVETLDTNKDYEATLSTRVKGQAGTKGRFYIFFLDENKNTQDGWWDKIDLTFTGDWQEVGLSLASPRGIPVKYAAIRIDNQSPNTAVYWDNLDLTVETLKPVYFKYPVTE